jgi:phosphoribosylaminoimidazolecarboxamide formyltransferase/IMP cyclohydrolase
MSERKISTALISVYSKEGLDRVVKILDALGIKLLSTGGTQSYIEQLGVEVGAVEDLTSYPSILGGRVKTLHPKVFGGILARRSVDSDINESKQYEIPLIDLVIVDLYPFEETVRSGADEQDIIEKIDIGGISLIRAAAKNFEDVLIISDRSMYGELEEILDGGGLTTTDTRRHFAARAFDVSSGYDSAIFNWFTRKEEVRSSFKRSTAPVRRLRYGENPHQKGAFYGDMDEVIEQLHGKEISYNNLLDIDAAVSLISEFDETTVAVLKHNNACGAASRNTLVEAWRDALAGDPVSAFGGVIVANREIDEETAREIDKIFFEVIIAPSYDDKALQVLKGKKNRIILLLKGRKVCEGTFRSVLNGVLWQERDSRTEKAEDMEPVTSARPDTNQLQDLVFANKIVKHSKSNTIVLAGNRQLFSSGVGMTSRVDALTFAVGKAKSFGFDLGSAVMASDAFFPFSDSVEIAHREGIKVVVQPGGSVRDNDSVEFCNKHGMAMLFTGVRHFRH